MRIANLRVAALAVGCAAVCGTALACGDVSGLAGKQGLPAGTGDPGSFQTVDGALGLYNATIAVFQFMNAAQGTEIGGTPAQSHPGVFVDYVMSSGILSDELQPGNLNLTNTPPVNTFPAISNFPGQWNYIDSRQLPEGAGSRYTDELYGELQGIRGGANMAIGMLTTYAPTLSPALAGHMHAMNGFAEVLLADMFCSGIPLSTLDFDGDFTYHAGSSTTEVYRDAITHFDLAIAASADSSRILNFARVGKGRALLALGHPDSAALAVADVPDDYTYQFPVDWTPQFASTNNRRSSTNVTVANNKGTNGLPYVTDGATDPRTQSSLWAISFSHHTPLYAPFKYTTSFEGSDPSVDRIGTVASITVSDWIEARLIRAEAALAANDVPGWLDQLNYLRANAITPALSTLSDPGDQASRVALLFKERAYWLYMSGHRQGDMRRLIRQYHLDATAVYPTGSYPDGTTIITHYGTDVNAPIPTTEHSNPLFTGCISRGA